jgi:hypothetical protein
MKCYIFSCAGLCLLAGLLAGCDSPSREAVAETCQGQAQQQCLIVALRDCRLATSARQDQFNACEPYRKCSDGELQKCIEQQGGGDE